MSSVYVSICLSILSSLCLFFFLSIKLYVVSFFLFAFVFQSVDVKKMFESKNQWLFYFALSAICFFSTDMRNETEKKTDGQIETIDN